MKKLFSILCLSLLIIACQEKPDNSAQLKFEKNSKTVLASLEAWQNENVDYSIFAEDYVYLETMFGAEKDSIGLEEAKEANKRTLQFLDFKFLGEPVLLPGVNPDTKLPDGSVRYYGEWEVTRPATDSTEAKSAVLKVYHSFDFNDEGKLAYEQMYGDFTGIMTYLNTPSDMGDMAEGQ